MMGASFRANLASIRGETTELRACQKVRTDRQTDRQTAFRLYIVDIYSKAIKSKAFLQKNLQRCPASVKSNCYISLVKPILEYAATV